MGSIKLPLLITAPCERENNHVFILTADSVQMCFLNGTCDTLIYPLWCLEPVLFTSLPAAQGKSVGNLQFFQTASLDSDCLFCFLSNLNHTSSPWEKGYLIKRKLFRTPPMRSSHSSPFGRDKGRGIGKKKKEREICLTDLLEKNSRNVWKVKRDQNLSSSSPLSENASSSVREILTFEDAKLSS